MGSNLNSSFLTGAVDEMERMALEEAARRHCFDPQTTALVLPGRCHLTYELARKGIWVEAGDKDGEQDAGNFPLSDEARARIHFVDVALEEADTALARQPFDIIICRNGLCALPYSGAKAAVRQLMRRLKIGGRLYLSVLGLHSELAYGYNDADVPVGERHCELSKEIATKYGISGKVCLYSERDLFCLILEAGGSVLRTFTTTHGNVKGVAVRV